MDVLTIFMLVITTAAGREYTDAEVHSFPKLYHLDDYERCLSRKNGLYCLGTFDLTPDIKPNPTYELLKAYSDESYRHYNRTRIHRGLCVSSRCPQESELNVSQRFERCADKWARTRTLRALISTLHYCHTYNDKHADQAITPMQLHFLQCVYAIIVVNIIGSIYDVFTKDYPDKNKLITAFSIPANWRRLTVIHEGRDPRVTIFTPFNGARVVVMAFTTYTHACVFHYSSYVLNPEDLERQSDQVGSMYLANGTSIIQVLVMLACFFTCYNLLLFSEKRALNLAMLPLCIIKRVIRITPVNLLVIGFAATWWPHIRNGPLVPTTIGVESDACKSKFWSQVFFYSNIVDRSDYCVLTTWFLSVDMHIYIVACTLTLIMWRHRSAAIKLYLILFFVSCALIAIIAYIREYTSIVFITIPENVRVTFRNSPSFTDFYISSWGSLPSCFVGLIMAHIQYEFDKKRLKLSECKLFVYLYYCSLPLVSMWGLVGVFVRAYDQEDRCSVIILAIYTALDRPIYCIIMGTAFLGIANIDGPIRRLYSWSKWTISARVSLSAMLLHWCVIMTITTRPTVFATSAIDVAVDWVATNVFTYALAIPITLFVEIPMQKFLGSLIF